MYKKIARLILIILSFVCMPNLAIADYFPKTWQIDDPVTLAGHKYLYYLINGTSRPSGQTFLLAAPS